MLSNYNSIFELSVALNIGYVSFEQLSGSIYRLFFSKVLEDLQELKTKAEEAKAKLHSIDDDRLNTEAKERQEIQINAEMNETDALNKEIKKKVDYHTKLISKNMKFFYILVAIISLILLIIGAHNYDNKINEEEAVFYLYSCALLLTISWFSFKLFYDSAKHAMDRLVLVILGIFVLAGFFFWYENNIYDFLKTTSMYQSFSGQIKMDFILLSLSLPFLITLLWFIGLFSYISFKYKPRIRKQFEDIKKHFKIINDAAIGAEAVETLNRFEG